MKRRRWGSRSRGGTSGDERPKDAGAAHLAAITLLARRDFAVGELRARLTEDGYPPDAVEPVIEGLLAARTLDDTRFAASYVAYHAGRGQGPRRIAMDLAERGVPEALIEAALATGPDWKALAREVRVRRFGPEAPQDWAEKARQARFLQYRGFSSDHMRSAIADFDPEDPS